MNFLCEQSLPLITYWQGGHLLCGPWGVGFGIAIPKGSDELSSNHPAVRGISRYGFQGTFTCLVWGRTSTQFWVLLGVFALPA